MTSSEHHKLSRPDFEISNPLTFCAVNCTGIADLENIVEDRVRRFVANSMAENSKRAYRADMEQLAIGGIEVPTAPEAVAVYLAAHAGVLSVATLARRLASLTKAHGVLGLESPAKSPIVRATFRGIKRKYGLSQRQARPLLRDDLLAILDSTGSSLVDARDRALLLVGFAGGFRRSELVSLDVDDLAFESRGVVITIRRSKTDQLGVGRKLAIPIARGRWCPVRELCEWLSRAEIVNGPVFRSMSADAIGVKHRLSPEAVSLVLKKQAGMIGLNPDEFSGHSLRAGFATSAAQHGVPSWKIRAQTGHASDAMLARYIRDIDLFDGNAASALFL